MTSGIRVIHESQDTRLMRATADGDALWLDMGELERATGWLWKPEGLCRGETCMPIPRGNRRLVAGERLDVAGVWRQAGWPVVHSRSGNLWVLGEDASRRAAALTSLQAPDFVLPDLEGRLHRLSDYRGRKVFLVTWASWCGCRGDLPVWQSLHETIEKHGGTVLAVALDQPDAARPWLEAASPGYPCLIDRDHLTAESYNLVNVPQAVWIDETGHMVRPPEPAGMTDSFRAMDRKSFAMPEAAREARDRTKAAYLDAVRDWAARGRASPYALDEKAVMARLTVPDVGISEAHAHFRLGQALLREGQADEAAAEFSEATRLHPESWAMWRQTAEKNASGLAVGQDFWRRVDALGARHYYAPVDLARRR
ncbi:redoxin domain-containing protein [Myxococcus stipitatus]|uniref:redoxin domain-containing protein n=1 Tax=Myxococcus stipitatus TaxID=83455 RepID=UPI001F2E0BBF|nr:redoxin domain-containing protein [Myxococcus stipitatus]MCE9673994.1 redoxin domain-containing protein [Myxococcus stipitatus]